MDYTIEISKLQIKYLFGMKLFTAGRERLFFASYITANDKHSG